jgi:microcystin-dependent protein
MWGGNETDIPLGWRLCDGGSLNGVTTPDLRGRFVLPYNNSAAGVNGSSTDGGNTTTGTGARTSTTLSGAVGRTGGEVLHTITTNELTTHNHSVTDPGHSHSATTYDAGSIHNDFGSNTSYAGSGTAYTNTNTTGITISNTGGSQPHNNIPPYYVLAFIMKCF